MVVHTGPAVVVSGERATGLLGRITELKREGRELGHLLDYAEKWNQADVSAATRGVGKDRLPIVDPAGPRSIEEHFMRLKRAVKEFDNAWHDATSNVVSTADTRKHLFEELLWEHRDLSEAHSKCQAIPEASIEALKTQLATLQGEKEQLIQDQQKALDAQKEISRQLKEQAIQAGLQQDQAMQAAACRSSGRRSRWGCAPPLAALGEGIRPPRRRLPLVPISSPPSLLSSSLCERDQTLTGQPPLVVVAPATPAPNRHHHRLRLTFLVLPVKGIGPRRSQTPAPPLLPRLRPAPNRRRPTSPAVVDPPCSTTVSRRLERAPPRPLSPLVRPLAARLRPPTRPSVAGLAPAANKWRRHHQVVARSCTPSAPNGASRDALERLLRSSPAPGRRRLTPTKSLQQMVVSRSTSTSSLGFPGGSLESMGWDVAVMLLAS
ncbi:hypothetical protein QYE76_011259 [Lolium multiflorum]|uniref:Uncharacterized protein n=1 Tax=Lolium multiflorum TaxID=4521 RepID=A0AAD8X540_LOLMU|nr:hypothetical protein QYE76_011259 [Lolium multiflorum]